MAKSYYNTSPRCSRCRKPIKGQKCVKWGGRFYHMTCFLKTWKSVRI